MMVKMKRKILLICIALILWLGLSGCDTTGINEELCESGYAGETEEFETVVKEEPVDQAIVYEQIKETVEMLNENSNLYMDMLSFVEEHEWLGGITPEEIRQTPHDEDYPSRFNIWNESNDVRLGNGLFNLFPQISDDIRLTQLIWDVPGSFHVFGIDVGSCDKEAEAILLQLGYEEREPHPHFQCENFVNRHNKRMRIFGKNLVSVSFFVIADGSEILELRVTVTEPFRAPATHGEEGEEGVDWVM
jgi:hypothetical protein